MENRKIQDLWLKDITETVTLAIIRAQTVSFSYHDVDT